MAWAWSPAIALGATCGGGVPCQCGNAVASDYTMTADLGPCPGHGLYVRSNVTLDCGGFAIVGLGDGSEQYGIYLDGDTGAEVTGATVKGCEITGFQRGIRLRAAEQSTILDSYTHGNGDFGSHVGYGIDVTLGSKNNLLQDNIIAGNADEGIHFASDTGPNQFVGNVLFDNYREQIYVLASDGNTFIGNTTYGAGSNSLYLKDSNNNYLEGNTFKDRTTKVIGASSDNTFVNNTFVNSALQFSVYSATPDRIPSNNTVAGGSMNNTGTCLRFTSTWGNVVSDLTLQSCGTQVMSESTTAEPSSNAVVSTALTSSKLSVDTASTLSVAWWLSVHVQDAAGAAIAGARVQALDAGGNLVFDLLTDASGNLPAQSLQEYVRTGSASDDKTPHTLTTSKTGYVSDSRGLQIVQDQAVTVVLGADGGAGGGGGTSGSFSDNFDRPDSTVVGNGWQPAAAGDFFVSAGELRSGAAKGNHLALVSTLAGKDQTAAADFASVDNNPNPRLGVMLRAQNAQNYYLVYRRSGSSNQLRIAKVVNGVETVLASMSIKKPALNTFFRVEGRAVGTTLTLLLDGEAKLSASDATFTSGSAGVLVGSNSIKAYRTDNFSATAQ
jgi:parallel beta-helix repeat protein